MPTVTPTMDEIEEMAARLAEIASRPELLAMAQQLRDAPDGEKPATAERVASVDYVAAQGVPIPEGLRISPRIFEAPDDALAARGQTDAAPVVSFEDGCGWVAYRGTFVTVTEAAP